jgi:hypothetical protein
VPKQTLAKHFDIQMEKTKPRQRSAQPIISLIWARAGL